MITTVPVPRAPLDGIAHWYERELGWAVADGVPVELLTGLRFDVLELPAEAGFAVLRRIAATCPVALAGQRMRLLVAAGSADELDGLLDWLDWGGIALDLTATGAGGRITAPAPPGFPGACSRGAARWLRPPEPGCEARLPAIAPMGHPMGHRAGPGDIGRVPDLVRLVDAAATECHRARLLRTNTQPLAFS
ncbi:SCO3374 family protein [Streptomyces sp. NPDC051219]|uniref:SCO3374 family protein n=1 Tax=Streptomyces sp. NPDC051219 TaxID=3155283 RepID=UPI00342B7470